MIRRLRLLAAFVTAVGLVAAGGSLLAQPKDKPDPQHDKQQQNKQMDKQHGKGGSPNAKSHKSKSGKDLLGDKIKQNGKHKIDTHGKFATSVDVQNGKVAGVKVNHADKGDVPVTKYKTNQKMASSSQSGIYLASYALAQDEYLGTTWIGYAYIDDYGEEIIYWFPYDMILDGDTGAIDYYPAA